MKAATLRLAVLVFLGLAAAAAAAAPPRNDRLVRIDTRPGVSVAYWVMPRDGATATVLLLPGGEGGIGFKEGVPTSNNFLVRSRDLFAAAGFNVAIVGKPSDRDDLDLVFRMGESHVEDLRRVVERVRRDFGKPVWLVGTSRGTTSAAAAAIALGPAVAGVVLTASITDGSLPGTIQNMPIGEIRVPVLVIHHRDDACRSTPARFAPRIVEGLANAPVKKLSIVEGGRGAYGNPCEAMHWHGFIGMEAQVVDEIARFIAPCRDSSGRAGRACA